MKTKKAVRTLFKFIIGLISVSIGLTSALGVLSMIKIVSDTNNIQIDTENMDFGFGPTGNNLTGELAIRNTGYFPFENFTVNVEVNFLNLTSDENISILDKKVFQDDIPADSDNFKNISVEAIEEDFNTDLLLADNGGSWNDSVVDEQIAIHAPLMPEQYAILQLLSGPFLLSAYNVTIILSISSKYSLGLVSFSLTVVKGISFSDLNTGYDTYEDLRNATFTGFGW